MAIAGGQTSKSAAKAQPTPEQVLAAKKVTQSSCEEFFARVEGARRRGAGELPIAALQPE